LAGFSRSYTYYLHKGEIWALTEKGGKDKKIEDKKRIYIYSKGICVDERI
jgi:hypothetical protein